MNKKGDLEIDIVKINDLYEGGAVYALAEEVPGMLKKLQGLFEQNQRMYHAIKKAQEFCKQQKPESGYQLDWAVDAVKWQVLEILKKANID